MSYLRAAIIIITTGIVGGAIAFLGNQLGRFVGRKKLSVFKLRPRYTSMLITILTGMMIASSTLLLAIIVSEPVRITIINPEQYRKKVRNLEERIEELAKMEKSNVVFKFEDTILSATIKPQPDTAQMEAALREVISRANQAAIQKSRAIAQDRGEIFIEPSDGKLVGYIPSNFKSVARELSRLTDEHVVFARAYKNAYLGEQFPIQLGKPIPNRLIFTEGELIHRAVINGTKDYFDIYNDLLRVMKLDVSQQAIYRGLFPNPDDGSVGEFDPERLKKLAEEIRKRKKLVTVEFYSAQDTHLLGPLMINIKLKE